MRLLRPMARYTAGWFYRLDTRGREAMAANLRVILKEDADEATIKRMVRQTFNHFAYFIIEFGKGGKKWKGRILFPGEEHLKKALAKGHGVLIVSAHYANWECGVTPFVERGYPMKVVVMEHPTPAETRLFNLMRQDLGVEAIFTYEGRKMIQMLKDNGVLAILPDRPVTGDVVFVEMFGKPIAMPLGAAKMSVKTGAPLVPCFVRREKDLSISATLQAPLKGPNEKDASEKERIQALMQNYADRLEAWIKEDPTQWTAFYKAWEVGEKGLDSFGKHS